ncbi:MAG: TIGR02452 family protein [Kiritimatiellae bacterium]|nr:TIGR02452 family protein [Kiritimatiellia bacterium]
MKGAKMHHHHHQYDPAIAERKQKNRDIFAETIRICQAGYYAAPSGAVVRLPAIRDVLKASVFYQNPPEVDGVPTIGTTVCDAVNGDCIDVTRKLVEDGYKPIMLNMANRHTPGGGVINGARAQEESLFRQSNLCVSLYQFDEYHAGLLGLPLGNGRYPMDRDTGGIYSGRVTFFRTSSRNGDALVETPFECAVVSVAAINRPDLTPDGLLVDWAVAATKKKIRTMLRIGLLHGHDAIVLGAWGCGAFRNPPEHMAQLFHEVLRETEFADKYRVVRFAVIEDHNSRHSNFAPFDREFNGRARTPAAPKTRNGAAGIRALPDVPESVNGAAGIRALPVRKRLDHRGPLCIDVTDAIYFVTIAAARRGGTSLTDNAEPILEAARFYQQKAKWFLHLFLIMPDHIHMLVHVPATAQLVNVIGHWKSFLTTQKGIRFQENFFDTRIRDEAHFAEKWNYICKNPVARGLVGTPREWNHVIAYDPQTGEERVHR